MAVTRKSPLGWALKWTRTRKSHPTNLKRERHCLKCSHPRACGEIIVGGAELNLEYISTIWRHWSVSLFWCVALLYNNVAAYFGRTLGEYEQSQCLEGREKSHMCPVIFLHYWLVNVTPPASGSVRVTALLTTNKPTTGRGLVSYRSQDS